MGWGGHDSRNLRRDHILNTKQHTSELEVEQAYELSRPTLSDALPPARLHHLPKQPHQLGTCLSLWRTCSFKLPQQ